MYYFLTTYYVPGTVPHPEIALFCLILTLTVLGSDNYHLHLAYKKPKCREVIQHVIRDLEVTPK